MDVLSALYALSNTFDDAAYQKGNAHGWLIKSSQSATTSYQLAGRLYVAKSGWLLLSVPNALVRGVFDALHAPGVELPLAGAMNVPNVDKDLLNAHVSVMTAAEVESIGADNINERGHTFRYTLGPVKEVPVSNIDGVSRVWFIQVASPELTALRKSYGLSPKMKGDEPFHITVALRRRNVMRDNDTSKCCKTSAETTDEHRIRNTYECGCSGRCTCPDSCICKKSGYCGHSKAAAHEGAPWGTPADKLPWRERVEVYAHDPKGRIYGGVWNTDKSFAVPGGGIDPGEDPGQAAIRELEEETGIKATNPRVLPIAPVDNPWSDKHRQEKQRNFAGSRTHFVAVDILKKMRRKNLDKWEATARKMYDPAAAAEMMANHQHFMAPTVAAGRLAALRHIIANAAKKTAADLLQGGDADNMPDSKFPPKALAEGKNHEHEHTTNDQIAGEIAKDHLQKDPAYYKKVRQIEKEAMPEIIKKLREAKEHSDAKRYDRKNAILRELMSKAPEEWHVDDPVSYHMGITHAPTKFRFHADPNIIPTGVKVKAAEANPYWAQLLNTTPVIDRNKSLWQNFFNHLRTVKSKGDWQHDARGQNEAWRAALIPGYREQMNMAIARGQYPKVNHTAHIIRNYGDSILNRFA